MPENAQDTFVTDSVRDQKENKKAAKSVALRKKLELQSINKLATSDEQASPKCVHCWSLYLKAKRTGEQEKIKRPNTTILSPSLSIPGSFALISKLNTKRKQLAQRAMRS